MKFLFFLAWVIKQTFGIPTYVNCWLRNFLYTLV